MPRGSVIVGIRTRRSELGGGGKPFEKAHSGFPQKFGVGHDMRLGDRHKIGRIKEFANGDLVRQRPASDLAQLAGEHRPLFIG